MGRLGMSVPGYKGSIEYVLIKSNFFSCEGFERMVAYLGCSMESRANTVPLF